MSEHAVPSRSTVRWDGPELSAAFDQAAADEAVARWASRAKPPGSLGQLESLAVRLAGITGTCPPPIPQRPAVALFAADHGVVADGASAWPSDITAAMVHTIAGGGAAINAFAATVGASVTVIDVGVASDLGALQASVPLLDRRVRPGTGSIVAGPAMTVDEAMAALLVGREVASGLITDGADCLVGGEMGIGNTTPSAALIAVLSGIDPVSLVGPGAGTPAAGVEHKASLVVAATQRAAAALERRGETGDPIALVAELGGLEIAALVGLYLGAAEARIPFIVDGVIAAAACCVAEALRPGVASMSIAGHRSTEPAATVALSHLGLEPLIDLDLRLGEGTGAVLAVPFLAAASRALRDMADLPVSS